MNITRRNFLKTSPALAAAIAVPSLRTTGSTRNTRVSANDKINVALIGCNNMGWYNLTDHLIHEEIRCVALCDIDKTVLETRTADVIKLKGVRPEQYGDYRKILDRKDVDIVIIGTPDHWHCLQFVDSCAAGKDVYVEKPIANSIAECDAMVAAAKRYDRVVQVGQQQRSSGHWQQMIEYLRSGKLGVIGHAHIWANFNYAAIPQRIPDSAVPEGVDFETWIGPTPKVTFNSQRFHRKWRMFWNYGGGLLTDWGVHLLDMGLWGLDVKKMPNKIVAAGGNFFYPDGAQETYDSQTVSYLFDDVVMSWEHNAGVEKGPYNRSYGVMFKGTNGTLVADRESWEIYPEWDNQNNAPKMSELIVKADHKDHKTHVKNFIDCVKTRNKQTACTIENGSLCAKYAHLGNISARLGGESLFYDDEKRLFKDNREADKLLKPSYRKPWIFPGGV